MDQEEFLDSMRMVLFCVVIMLVIKSCQTLDVSLVTMKLADPATTITIP